ncbi:MAG: tRNA guanosine(34) transglycosylase Tgt, partial [Beijerinckiaceae bacterium]
AEAPRYLMGVGTPHDMLEAVKRGVDMFDCVMPTRNGRHGMAFTRFGSINLGNARHANDPRPLDEESPHPVARTYARAYLHHLTKAGEMLGQMLLTWVNIAYYQDLMAGLRNAIATGRLDAFIAETKLDWKKVDGDEHRSPAADLRADAAGGESGRVAPASSID